MSLAKPKRNETETGKQARKAYKLGTESKTSSKNNINRIKEVKSKE